MGKEEDRELTHLLEDAADGKPGAIAAFFELLLRSSLYVAKPPDAVEAGGATIPQGHFQTGEHGYLTVNYDGRECLPIFTEAEFVSSWAGVELPLEQKPLAALLWLIRDESWMYINPNQEIGKELTFWEIEQLRQGADAIPDLVAALEDEPFADFEVRTGVDLFPELKRQLIPVLEIAKQLEEAFLVAVREENAQNEKPVLGLKYGDIDKSVRLYIRTEIEETVKAMPDLGDGTGQIIIVDDLGDPRSPNHGLFEDATPFFMGAAAKSGPGAKAKNPLRDALQSLFGMGKPAPARIEAVTSAKEEEE